MSAITAGQAYALLRQAGATDTQATMLTAIGGAESGLDPASIGDVGLENGTWGPSVGIWQVRTLKAETGKGTDRDANHLTNNPQAQAAAAVAIAKGGLTPWSTYTSGAYRKFLPGASSASGAENANWQNALPWNWGSTLEKKGQQAVQGAVSSAAGAIWSSVAPFMLNGIFAIAGLGLIGAGIVITAKPAADAARQQGEQQAQQLAPLIAAV